MIEFDFASLRLIGLNNLTTLQLASIDIPGRLARVTEVQRDWITVHDGQQEWPARPLHGTVSVVGDWVVIDKNIHNEVWITFRLPPGSELARRQADGRRQALASNIDTALLVMGLDNDFNPRRLERYIAVATSAGIAPVIVLSKADLYPDAADRLSALNRRLPPGIPAVAINALSPDAAIELMPWLGSGQTICLLGSSGAGKSTLTNNLCGTGQETGGVRKGDQRGRHTTTARSMYISQFGACIIDTPGLRSWSPESIESAFDDIETLALDCQFRDCHHELEPGCAVRGVIDPDRLLNYHKLLREMRRAVQTPLDRIAERAKWKTVMKSAREKRNSR